MQQYYENRLKVLAFLKAGGVNPYPHKFHVSVSVVEYVEKYGSLSDGEHLKDVEVGLAGTFFMEYLLGNLFSLHTSICYRYDCMQC